MSTNVALLGSDTAPLSTTTRSRPVVTNGPIRTLRTDTGQIIRAATGQINTGTSGGVFSNTTWANGRALGLNTLRCGIQKSTNSMSVSAILANVDLVVELARVNRMYCMLGYFAASPGAYDDDVAGNEARWNAFWSVAAPRYKDNSWVFFEQVNEPWAFGQLATLTAATKASLKRVYDTMRAGAPDTVIGLLGTANLSPSASQYAAMLASLDSLGNGVPIDWSNTVLAHHYYNQTYQLTVTGNSNNATDGGRAGLTALAADYPLLGTETNWYVEQVREPLIDALDLYEDLGIGWTLLRTPGQTSPVYSHDYDDNPNTPDTPAALGPAYLENKVEQLRSRGYLIPVE